MSICTTDDVTMMGSLVAKLPKLPQLTRPVAAPCFLVVRKSSDAQQPNIGLTNPGLPPRRVAVGDEVLQSLMEDARKLAQRRSKKEAKKYLSKKAEKSIKVS